MKRIQSSRPSTLNQPRNVCVALPAKPWLPIEKFGAVLLGAAVLAFAVGAAQRLAAQS